LINFFTDAAALSDLFDSTDETDDDDENELWSSLNNLCTYSSIMLFSQSTPVYILR
jgi:hypothetical protein